MRAPLDAYTVLGLVAGATEQQIRRAFRRIARDCHPDVAGDDPEKADRFRRARDAYEALLDPERRPEPPPPPRARPEERAARFGAFYRRAQEAAAEDVFRDFGFGGDEAPRARVRGTPGAEEPRVDAPRAPRVDVPVTTAMLGGVVEAELPAGRVRVRVPAGTSSGTRLRLRSDGAEHLVEVRIVVPTALDDESAELVRRLAARLGS